MMMIQAWALSPFIILEGGRNDLGGEAVFLDFYNHMVPCCICEAHCCPCQRPNYQLLRASFVCLTGADAPRVGHGAG